MPQKNFSQEIIKNHSMNKSELNTCHNNPTIDPSTMFEAIILSHKQHKKQKQLPDKMFCCCYSTCAHMRINYSGQSPELFRQTERLSGEQERGEKYRGMTVSNSNSS